LLVSGDPLARGGLFQLLGSQPGISVTSQAQGDERLDALTRADDVDAVVWDVGVEPARNLERMRGWAGLQLPTVALVPDEKSASDAFSAGARGLLLRSVEGGKLGATVKAVTLGLVVLDDSFSGALPGVRALSVKGPTPEALTPRETQVLSELARGLSNKEIATALDISEHTAKFHVNAVMQKLGVQNRTEAVVRAVRLGLLML
jgi:DNA-binding NarL/FixJ family response regulator